MSEVKRYSPGYRDNYRDGGFEDCKESADGELVSYKDYAALEEQFNFKQNLTAQVVALEQQRDALAAENAALKSNLMFWDEEDPEMPYDHPEEIANNCAMEVGTEFDVQVAAKMPNRTYRVSEVDDYDCTVELVCGAMPETPATDAYLNSVRAEGVEMLAESLIENGVCTSSHTVGYFKQFSSQLRAGKDGE